MDPIFFLSGIKASAHTPSFELFAEPLLRRAAVGEPDCIEQDPWREQDPLADRADPPFIRVDIDARHVKRELSRQALDDLLCVMAELAGVSREQRDQYGFSWHP